LIEGVKKISEGSGVPVRIGIWKMLVILPEDLIDQKLKTLKTILSSYEIESGVTSSPYGNVGTLKIATRLATEYVYASHVMNLPW
jgi:hypothetical protein